MKKFSQHWVDLDHGTLHQVPKIWQPWVSDTGSFTQLLACRIGQPISVSVIHDGRQTVAEDEQALFAQTVVRCRIREVFLCANDTPVVMARSVLPTYSATRMNRDLLRIGSKPLGEVLFAKKKAPIIRRQITEIPNLGWGRRTLYQLRGHPILITEILLPELVNQITN